MLTEEDLDRIADEHARASVHLPNSASRLQVVAVRRFALARPPGVYYTLSVEPEDEDAAIVGSGGFFVHQADGRVTTFGSGEVIYTWAALAQEQAELAGDEISPAVIQHLLTHPRDERLLRRGFHAVFASGRDSGLPRHGRGQLRPKRRWWKFWG